MLKRKYSLILLFLTLAGAFLREKWLFSSLEYDEIWTLMVYAGKPVREILTDLSTPNNHPLNTLGIKLTLLPGWTGPCALRIIPFLAGLLSVPLAGWIGKKLFSSRAAGLGTAGLMAVSQPLIFYSGTARGYALQVFLLLLFSAFLLKSEKKPLHLAGAFAAGILAMLDLTTSVLFLFPVSLIHELDLLRKKEWKRAASAAAVLGTLGIFILCWCLGNLEKIQAGQGRFGTEIRTVSAFFGFLGTTLYSLGGAVLLSAALCGWLFTFRKRLRFSPGYGAFLLLFPLAGALLFRSGPPRVYLPLIPLLCLWGGYALARSAVLFRKSRKVCLLLLVLLCGGVLLTARERGWSRIDWNRDFTYLAGPGGFSVLPAESLPLGWNRRNEGEFFADRILSLAPGGSFTAIGGPVTALTREGTDLVWEIPCPVFRKYGTELRHLSVKEFTGKEKFFLIRGMEVPQRSAPEVLKKVSVFPGIRRAGFLNYWTDTRIVNSLGQIRFLLLAEQDPPGTNRAALSAMLAELPGTFDFFTLEKHGSRE